MPALDKAGIQVAVNEDYPPDIKDMTAMLTAVKAANPDAVLALSYPGDSIVYMNQARELGIESPFQFVLVGPTIDFFGQMFGSVARRHRHHRPLDAGRRPTGRRPSPSSMPTSRSSTSGPTISIARSPICPARSCSRRWPRPGSITRRLREAIASGTFDTINGPVKFEGVQNVDHADRVPAVPGRRSPSSSGRRNRDGALQPKRAWPK